MKDGRVEDLSKGICITSGVLHQEKKDGSTEGKDLANKLLKYILLLLADGTQETRYDSHQCSLIKRKVLNICVNENNREAVLYMKGLA